MVNVEFHTDNLKHVQASDWKPPADHPDLMPAHEALQLAEYLRELGRTEETAARPDEFRRLLAESERAAFALHELLSSASPDSKAADNMLKVVTGTCVDCHKGFRD
jgi:hypothetical protein